MHQSLIFSVIITSWSCGTNIWNMETEISANIHTYSFIYIPSLSLSLPLPLSYSHAQTYMVVNALQEKVSIKEASQIQAHLICYGISFNEFFIVHLHYWINDLSNDLPPQSPALNIPKGCFFSPSSVMFF